MPQKCIARQPERAGWKTTRKTKLERMCERGGPIEVNSAVSESNPVDYLFVLMVVETKYLSYLDTFSESHVKFASLQLILTLYPAPRHLFVPPSVPRVWGLIAVYDPSALFSSYEGGAVRAMHKGDGTATADFSNKGIFAKGNWEYGVVASPPPPPPCSTGGVGFRNHMCARVCCAAELMRNDDGVGNKKPLSNSCKHLDLVKLNLLLGRGPIVWLWRKMRKTPVVRTYPPTKTEFLWRFKKASHSRRR